MEPVSRPRSSADIAPTIRRRSSSSLPACRLRYVIPYPSDRRHAHSRVFPSLRPPAYRQSCDTHLHNVSALQQPFSVSDRTLGYLYVSVLNYLPYIIIFCSTLSSIRYLSMWRGCQQLSSMMNWLTARRSYGLQCCHDYHVTYLLLFRLYDHH